MVSTRRAAPLPPAQRREALIEATVATLRRLGRPASTREIAEAAGVAEGTIFRVFASKEELIDAAVRAAFDPEPFYAEIDAIDLDQPLRDRLVSLVTVMQERFLGMFKLMAALGLTSPPPNHDDLEAAKRWRQQTTRRMTRILGDDIDQITCEPEELPRYLRLLTFSGSHVGIGDGSMLTPETIVDVVLYGVAAGRPGCPGPHGRGGSISRTLNQTSRTLTSSDSRKAAGAGKTAGTTARFPDTSGTR
jgi:AcrR family transcriptional regulator